MSNSAPKSSAVTVHILGGRIGISQLNSWEDREAEPLPDEVEIGFSSHDFGSSKDADAFRTGVDAGAGWLGFDILAQTSVSRTVRFGVTPPTKTKTFHFADRAEAEAFDQGLSAAEGWSEIVVLEADDAADILSAKERQLAPAP